MTVTGLIGRSGPNRAARRRRISFGRRWMDLSALLPLIDEAVDLDRLRRRMSVGKPLMLGVSDGAKAAVLAALSRGASNPLLVLTAKPQQAEALADELEAWLGESNRG